MSPWWLPRAPVIVEPAGLDDAATLAQIHAAAFGRDWSADEFAVMLREPTVFGLIARRANLFGTRSAIGFILMRIVADEAEVLTIAVDPSHRSRGVGRELMDFVFRKLYRDRIASVFLEVDAENRPALNLYSRLGFAKVGERKGYYQNGTTLGATALVMRADLR